MIQDKVSTPKEINLEALLEFHHEETILRFLDCFDMPYEEAADIFREMKLLLALMAKYPEEYIFTHEPLWVIDEMWHTFLMYSKDYEEFCYKYFGKMMHHEPIERAKKMEVINRLETDQEETEKELSPYVRNLYSLIYDYLGRDTLVKWVHVYGQKYTIAHMNTIRKPIQ